MNEHELVQQLLEQYPPIDPPPVPKSWTDFACAVSAVGSAIGDLMADPDGDDFSEIGRRMVHHYIASLNEDVSGKEQP